MKFESKKVDLVVYLPKGGKVVFYEGIYETTDKAEIAALKKAKNVSEVTETTSEDKTGDQS